MKTLLRSALVFGFVTAGGWFTFAHLISTNKQRVPDRLFAQTSMPKPVVTPPTAQRIFATLPAGDWWDGELVLNNNSPNQTEITSTFYSEGTAADGARVSLQPSEVRWVKLSELSAPTGKSVTRQDSLELQYLGHMLEVGAQITLLQDGGAGFADIPFSGESEYHSPILEGVWPAPLGSEAHVSISNSSDKYVTVSVQQAGKDEIVEFGPHASQTLTIETSRVDAAHSVGSMTIDSRGPIGAIRATGFVELGQRPISGIRFYDPSVARQTSLFATNLDLERTVPIMVLKNTTSNSISAIATFVPFSSEFASLTLPAVSLNSREAKVVNLRPLLEAASARGKELSQVSVKVSSSGQAGSLIGELAIARADGSFVSDIPLRDSGPVRKATGSYPWRLDGDYNTIVTVTNVIDSVAKFQAWINYPGGSYQFTARELQAGETATFDLRKLRDLGVKDVKGHSLPTYVLGGQFRWSIAQGGGETKLNGRAEIASVKANRRSSYSCEVCCPNSFMYGSLVANSLSMEVGDTSATTVWGSYQDCYGSYIGDYSTYPTTWSIQYPSIMNAWTVTTGQASAQGLAGGTSNFDGDWTDDIYLHPDAESCNIQEVAAYAAGQVQSGCSNTEKDSLIQEYRNYSLTQPHCADFTQTRRSTYFSFGEINTGDYSWALVRDPLPPGLDSWLTNYGSSRIINSSYRNPVRNAAVGGAFSPPSRHMYGDAADFRNSAGNVNNAEYWAMVTAASNASADYIEDPTLACHYACVHADWRGHTGGY